MSCFEPQRTRRRVSLNCTPMHDNATPALPSSSEQTILLHARTWRADTSLDPSSTGIILLLKIKKHTRRANGQDCSAVRVGVFSPSRGCSVAVRVVRQLRAVRLGPADLAGRVAAARWPRYMNLDEEALRVGERHVRKVNNHEATGRRPYEPYIYMISTYHIDLWAFVLI